eukprot:m.215216 g.215216  ORF g.215216 m.215216 type:complete len:270 (-) comp18632_c0_seq3:498-1307(-)
MLWLFGWRWVCSVGLNTLPCPPFFVFFCIFFLAVAVIPGKGEVLTSISAWWFKHLSHIIPHHMVSQEGNTMVCRRCEMFPIEFVVRGYLEGSAWRHYEKTPGEPFCGNVLPPGLAKGQQLPEPLVTPTTKAPDGEHDAPITGEELVASGAITQAQWDEARKLVVALYKAGLTGYAKCGLKLVDTKYELGRDLESGAIVLCDEVHTPDSSRLRSSTDPKEFYDKDILREWIRSQCDPYATDFSTLTVTDDVSAKLIERYRAVLTRLQALD